MRHEDEAEVLFDVDGGAGHITLNRPRAINALTHGMVRAMDETLAEWERDPAVGAVVLTGTGERGLCAGGDIRAIHEDARAKGGASALFWRDEYRLNARVARYPKPYVAVMDGIVMGGGVGVSAHGGVRLVTERSRVAMPETGIGFVPDVGGTYLLSRAPGELGTCLALTGEAVGAADALLCGLADHFVPSDALPALLEELTRAARAGDPHAAVAETVARYEAGAPEGELGVAREWIDRCFAAGTVEEILERLRAEGSPGAKQAAGTLEGRSPTSLKVTLEAVRRARELGSLEEVLEQEYRVSCACLEAPDLVEGIRAQVVDKDRDPRWNPATLAGVTEEAVARCFAPREDGGLGLA